MKYLELFKDTFDSTVSEKIKPENWPYVAYSPIEGFAFTVIPEPVTGPADNEIWYTNTYNVVITPYLSNGFGSNIIDNTCKNGKGVITFDGDVTSIGKNAFYNRPRLTSIVIPDSVTSIGKDAFWGCSSLVSINIPEIVTSIGDGAFSGCSSLASINIPEGVSSIGNSAFSGCSGLTSITIPNNVTSIGNSVFQYCSGLTSITISKGVTSIGDQAFYYCSSLTSITIPNSVTSIGSRVFRDCSSLTSIKYEGTQEQWNTISKKSNWNDGIPATYVQFSDGPVTL